MAIFYSRVSTIGKSKNMSAVKAAAYRSGESLTRDLTGETADYTRKQGIIHTEIIAPKGSPAWTSERALLWNKVEATETRNNARYARELILALPYEISEQENIEMVREYVKRNITPIGMIADIAIHTPDDGREGIDQRNIHAHIMLTDRPLDGEEFAAKKNEDWNKKKLILNWRKDWERTINQVLEENGIEERVDCRSYKEQGSEKIPQIKEGKYTTVKRRRGKLTDKAEYNELVKQANDILNQIEEERKKEAEIKQALQEQKQQQLSEAADSKKQTVEPPDKHPEEIRTDWERTQRLAIISKQQEDKLDANQTRTETTSSIKTPPRPNKWAVYKQPPPKPINELKAIEISREVANRRRDINQSKNATNVYRMKLAEITFNSPPEKVAESYHKLDRNALECDRRIRAYMRNRGFSDTEIRKAMRRASPALYRKSEAHAERYAREFSNWAAIQRQRRIKKRPQNPRSRGRS